MTQKIPTIFDSKLNWCKHCFVWYLCCKDLWLKYKGQALHWWIKEENKEVQSWPPKTDSSGMAKRTVQKSEKNILNNIFISDLYQCNGYYRKTSSLRTDDPGKDIIVHFDHKKYQRQWHDLSRRWMLLLILSHCQNFPQYHVNISNNIS